MSQLADLNKLDFPSELIYDGLVALNLPPFDCQVVFSSGINDPKWRRFPG